MSSKSFESTFRNWGEAKYGSMESIVQEKEQAEPPKSPNLDESLEPAHRGLKQDSYVSQGSLGEEQSSSEATTDKPLIDSYQAGITDEDEEPGPLVMDLPEFEDDASKIEKLEHQEKEHLEQPLPGQQQQQEQNENQQQEEEPQQHDPGQQDDALCQDRNPNPNPEVLKPMQQLQQDGDSRDKIVNEQEVESLIGTIESATNDHKDA